MKKTILVILVAVMILSAFALGNITALKEAECTKAHTEDYDVTSEKIYDLIIYEGEQDLQIVTEHKYLNGLPDGSLLITEKQITSDKANELIWIIHEEE